MNDSDAASERAAMEALERALDQSSADREASVLARADLDETTKDRVLRLLRAGGEPRMSLQTGGIRLLDDIDDEVPDELGPYRVLRLIGRGGMGNVYLAERAAKDFDHIVAIKVIKHRLVNPEIVERFRRERQTLADLNHPNIARLFDGGETDQGSPYFVMEYVSGQPLDKWLSGAAHDLNAKLEVFRQICRAVEAAHQRLIVHRDLTPPNILVTDDDQVKLIDFGIAKPEEPHSLVQSGQADHTPGFAAPEQRSGGPANTLTDTYALGKLLKMLLGDEGDAELIAVANKAAAILPDDRYPSVSALIEDIDNRREHRPVSAVNGRATYYFWKLVRRQRMLIGALAAVFVAVVTALILVSTAYRETDIARGEAEQRLSETRDLANIMMFDVFDQVSEVPGATKARLVVAQTAQRYLESLADNPDASLETRLAAGRGYFRLATVTGSLASGNIGELAQGLALFERAAEILEPTYAEAPDDEIRLALASVHVSLARDKLLTYVDTRGAVDHAERADNLLNEVQSPTIESVALQVRALRYLGDARGCCNDDIAGTRRAFERAVEIVNAAPEEMRQSAEIRHAYIDLRHLLAGLRIVDGDADGAIEGFEQVLQSQRDFIAANGSSPTAQRQLATISINLAKTYLMLDQPALADRVLQSVFAATDAARATDPNDYDLQRTMGILVLTRADTAAALGRNQEARQLLESGLDYANRSEWPGRNGLATPMRYAHRLQEASNVFWRLGDRQEACKLMRPSIQVMRDFENRGELPMTTARYRMAPMLERIGDCPTFESL